MRFKRCTTIIKRSFSYVSHFGTTYDYSKRVNPDNNFSGFFKRRKFETRLFFFYGYYLEILELFRDSRLSDILHENIRILDKVCRKYVICRSTGRERFDLLHSNYLFVRDNFSPSLIRSIFLSHDFPLCRIELPTLKREIVARLAYLSRFEKEGELTIELLFEGERRLYSVTFSIRVQGDSPEAVIGCILGPDRVSGDDEADRQLVKSLTKEMHGIRPKNLVIFLLQAFCRYFGISRLYAVAFDSHIYGGDPALKSRISCDYDLFWKELGGEPNGNCLYSLPLVQHRRSHDEIPSNKRAAYARRYNLLDDLESQMFLALGEINPRQV